MDNIINLCKYILNNDSILSLLSVVVSCLFSYKAGSMSVSKPYKIAIKQKQFEGLYLPLYRLLNSLPENPSVNDVYGFANKLAALLDSNYELAFPTLHDLNESLQKCISSNADCNELITEIRHQVSVDYQLLKKFLGYPSESYLSLYKRMSSMRKGLLFLSWFNMILVFSPAIVAMLFVKKHPEIHSVYILTYYMAIEAIAINITVFLNRRFHSRHSQ